MVKSIVLTDGNSECRYLIYDNLETAAGKYHFRRGGITVSQEYREHLAILWKGPDKNNPKKRFEYEVLDIIPSSENEEEIQKEIYNAAAKYGKEVAKLEKAARKKSVKFYDHTERGRQLGRERLEGIVLMR